MKLISQKQYQTQLQKRAILYYPTINIPTDDWLRNAVLYWDEVSSIIPMSWEDKHLIELSKDIEFLMKEGQFSAVRPEEMMRGDWQNVQDFLNEFKETISSKEFKALQDERKRKYSGIHGKKLPKSGLHGKGSRIHYDKMSSSILQYLEARELAFRQKEDSEWVQFESNTALIYMSLLAKYLARMKADKNMYVGTDLQEYENLNFRTVSNNEGMPVINCTFHKLIPSPSKNAPIKEILKFKRMRESNLLAFRKILLEAQNKIAAAETNEHVKEIIASFHDDMRKGLIDMAAVFKDSKLDLVFKSMKAIFNPKSSTLITGAAVLANEKYKIAGVPDWLNGIAIAAAASIDIGSAFIDVRNKLRAEDRRSAYAYLYHAQKRGFVNRFS